MNFILERLKAAVAVIIPGIVTAVIAGIEAGVGADIISANQELAIISAITGLFVWAVPNIVKK